MVKRLWITTLFGFFLLGLLGACRTQTSGTPSPETPQPQPTFTVKPEPSPTLTPVAEGLIVVDPARIRQTVRDLGGGNFIHKYSGREEVLDPVGAMNVNTTGNPRSACVDGVKGLGTH